MSEEISLGVIVERMTNNHNELKTELISIHQQTTKTNGRVTTLEDRLVKDAIWRARVQTGLWIIGAVFSLILAPLLVLFIQHKMF